MWWRLLPLAPGVPERLIVGNERAFLTWFYEGATADQKSISQAAIEETLRTFSGTKGALGSLGVYRAAFKAIEQTTPLKENKVKIPILAIGGEKGLGAKVAQMLEAVAEMSPERLSTPAGIHTGRAASGILPVFPRISWKGIAGG